MSSKITLVLCVQALFVQVVLSQCTSRAAVAADPGLIAPGAYGLGAPCGLGAPYGFVEPALAAPYGIPAPWGFGAPAVDFTPTSGGGLPVSSSSPIAPIGISVVSENVYEGPLFVSGELPFVGTVAMDGVLPSAGSGAINHACGNGVNAMISDITAFAPGYVEPFAPGYAGAFAPGYVDAFAPGYAGAIAPGYPGAVGCGYVL